MMLSRQSSLKLRQWLPVACLFLFVFSVIFFLPPSDVWASDTEGNSSAAGSTATKSCPGEGLIARIVPCITSAMEKSTYKLTNSLSSYLWPATSLFIVLVIILYGVKIMSPEGAPQRTVIPLLLKIGFVILFTQNFGGFIPAVHGGIKEVVDILANTLTMSTQCSSSGGSAGSTSGGAAAMGSDKIWSAMDCLLGKLFGFAGKDGNAMLIASIFGLIAGFLFGGSFGIIAFFSVVGVLWSILIFISKAVFAFLNGFMLACFAVIISPIFIPLLLMQVPSRYFNGWIQLLTGAFIMPTLVVGYCVIALSIYDKVLFNSEEGAAMRKTMEKSFGEAITGKRKECLGTLLNNVSFQLANGMKPEALKSDSVPNPVIPQQSGANSMCIDVPNLDLQKMMGGFKNKQEFFKKIFDGGIKLFLLAWLLSQGLESIIQLARLFQATAASALMGAISSVEQRINTAMKNAEEKMQQKMKKPDGSDSMGTEFMRNIPNSLSGAISGFFRGFE
jgi:type IV secretory pathway VirB6-like protein